MIFHRLACLLLPLLAVAVASAPEWPARTQMLDSPQRAVWNPLAEQWATAVARAYAAVRPSPLPMPSRAAQVVFADPPPSAPPAVEPGVVAATPKEGGTLLMVGDSLMGGVVIGLRQHLPRSYEIIDKHKVSTGLTNQQYYDWPVVAYDMVLETKPDWVVIHLGGNDGQDMRTPEGWLKLGSPEWNAAYRARAEALIWAVRDAHPQAQIAWLGLPAMRGPAYEAKSAAIAQLHRAAAESLGVPYIDGRAVLGEAYSKDGVGRDGTRRVWRADDGIHYSRAAGGELGMAVGDVLGWAAP